MTVTVYGIPNCDTIKKARTWLTDHGVAYDFHDYKKQGVDPALLADWIAAAGTTFRKLPDADKVDIDAAKAARLLEANPSMIKRPIVVHPGGVLVGFSPSVWEQALI